jgi:MoxR-like ATPase
MDSVNQHSSIGDETGLGPRFNQLTQNLEAGLIGRLALVDRLLMALLIGGHVLIEGAPGLAKTRAVKQLSNHVDTTFARIQCTPDLMPADLTGTPIWRPDQSTFEFVPGPVFHSLILVDEINRAPPKVQSALLEAMAEQQVTAAGKTYPLPDPFMVVATQNPIEHEGTFPLPEAQLDRFLFHVAVDFPNAESEREILDLVEQERGRSRPVVSNKISIAEIQQARLQVNAVHLAPALKDYIVRLVMATRNETGGADTRAKIEYSVSPRGSLSLAAAVKARAFLGGRDYGTPDDVQVLAEDVLAHRLGLTWKAMAEGETPRGVIATILERIAPL